MSLQPGSIYPPVVARWLIALFAPAQEAEMIIGDLQEEFSKLASTTGVAFARSWYWRQSITTIAAFVRAGFRTAPWSTAAAVIIGVSLLKLDRFCQPAMTAVLDRYHVYEHYPSVYIFCLSYGILIGHVWLAALVGAIVAALARDREMTATITLGFVGGTLTVAGFFWMIVKNVHFLFWMLPWSFASPVVILVGGAIVRMCRSAKVTRTLAS
jgi:hypothetical protein